MFDIPPFPRTSPEAKGVSSPALPDLVDALDKTITEMHGLVLLRHGRVNVYFGPTQFPAINGKARA